jgi:hypothetical protein
LSSPASLRSLPAKLRLLLGAQDLVLTPGEAVEFLVLFGRQGERAHLRVRPKASAD